jgi:hypothetical protein
MLEASLMLGGVDGIIGTYLLNYYGFILSQNNSQITPFKKMSN